MQRKAPLPRRRTFWGTLPAAVLAILTATVPVALARPLLRPPTNSVCPGAPPLSRSEDGLQAAGITAADHAVRQTVVRGPVQPGLEAEMAAHPDRPLEVVVRYRPGYQSAAITGLGPRLRRHLRLDHSVAARLTPAEIRRLAACGAVERIEPDLRCHATRASSQASFGVSQARADFGLNGDGDGAPGHYSPQDHTIAVIDTGIDGSHQDFAGGKILAWKDFVQGRTGAYDDNGHGTHVASIAAGRVNGAGVGGVAPAAALVALKVLDADGTGDSSVIAQGIEWCIANRQQYGIRVINLSLSADGSSDGTDLLSRTVDRAVAAGIVVCVAAGNDGPGRATISTPAAAAGAITVGNMADVGRGGFALLPHSSRGPTADGRVKPDLCAPGYQILAAKAGSGSDYVTLSGTSMAAPFVAGVAALLLQAEPGLTPAQVKGLLKGTAVGFGGAGENNEYGAGRLDAYAALARAIGRSGAGPAVPNHLHGVGFVQPGDDPPSWELEVQDISFPVAVTSITDQADTQFSVEVNDPDGSQVALEKGDGREALVSFWPSRTGTFTLTVRSSLGASRYDLDFSAAASTPAPPAAPSGLSATMVSQSQINLAWRNTDMGATVLEITRSGAGADLLVATLPAGTTRFTDRGLRAGTAYTYRVRAIGLGGPSPWSNETGGTTPPNPPAAPAALTASSLSRSQISLAWADRSSNETAFDLSRKSGTGPYLPIGILPPDTIRFIDSGLAAGRLFTYRIRAINAGGASPWSNIAAAATLPDPPTAPRNLSARAVSPGEIRLVWQDRSINETGFELFRRRGAGEFARIARLSANVTSFIDRGVGPDSGYTYRVQAINSGGSSPCSNEVTITTLPDPPAAPSGLSARVISATQVDLTWADAGKDETGFAIYRKSRNGAFAPVRVVGPNSTHFSDRGLSPGTPYIYRVRSVNRGGSSAWSNEASGSTLPISPRSGSITPAGHRS